jgi:cupin fold WbuC family metalloprotein
MIKTKKFNDEVFYADEDVIQVGKEDIEFLKQKALSNPRKRCRLCTHKDVNDKIHEMIIVHTKDTYVRPHKHLNKAEAFHIIEGSADVVVFDEQGKITQVIAMGDYSSGRKFYYKLSNPYYHTLLIGSDVIVFKETTNGPFRKEETIFAPWSPEDTDQEGIKKFIRRLEKSIK